MNNEPENAHPLEPVILRLQERLLSELRDTEDDPAFSEEPLEKRTRVLTNIVKALQGVEDMINRIKKDRERDAERGIDVVEYRRQLEEAIAGLVDGETAPPVSGGAE